MSERRISSFWEIDRAREPEFLARGFKKRHVFSHRTYYLPKCGPDGFKLATWMCGPCEVDQLWEAVLYADPSLIEEFPRDLFFDDDIVWHQQQFGKPGQIATADLAIVGDTLHTMAHLSDLFQRISRRREYKTRVETRFKGWSYMLLNSIVNFARERNLAAVRTPTSTLALRHTDPKRNPQAPLFERVYDQTVQRSCVCRQDAEWWVIRLDENRERFVRPERRSELMPEMKTICVCHDVERGLGHLTVDPSFARLAEASAPGCLDAMLAAESRAEITATYNVVGTILPDVRARIEADGHCLGFHSFDHRVERRSRLEGLRDRLLRRGDAAGEQLPRCRNLDYRIKGYRPPQSLMTPELDDRNLCYFNFEWLASSTSSLEIEAPELRKRVVRIPIAVDDFDLHRQQPYDRWEARLLEHVAQLPFAAISLHDCYGDRWLPHYDRLLEKLSRLGQFQTLDQVASAVTLAAAQ